MIDLNDYTKLMKNMPTSHYKDIQSDYAKGWNDCLSKVLDGINKTMKEQKNGKKLHSNITKRNKG